MSYFTNRDNFNDNHISLFHFFFNDNHVTLLTFFFCPVRCGMTTEKIVGPFILYYTMNIKRYLTVLQDEIWPVISAWENIDLIFMHDDSPSHFALVCEWLDAHFSGR